jgi:hypothetical protein
MWYVLYSPSTNSFLTHDGFGQLSAARAFASRDEASVIARTAGCILDVVSVVNAKRRISR